MLADNGGTQFRVKAWGFGRRILPWRRVPTSVPGPQDRPEHNTHTPKSRYRSGAHRAQAFSRAGGRSYAESHAVPGPPSKLLAAYLRSESMSSIFRASWSNTFFAGRRGAACGGEPPATDPHFCIEWFHLRRLGPWHPQRTRGGGDWSSVLSNLGKHLRAPGSPLGQVGRTGRRRWTPVPVLGLGGQRGGS